MAHFMQLFTFVFVCFCATSRSQESDPRIDSLPNDEISNEAGTAISENVEVLETAGVAVSENVNIEDISHDEAEQVIETYEKALETTGMSKDEAWDTIHKFEKMISEGHAEEVINNFVHLIGQPGARKILSKYEMLMSQDDARRIIGSWENMMSEGHARQIISVFEELLKKDGARQAITEYKNTLGKADAQITNSGNSKNNGDGRTKLSEAEIKRIIDDYNMIAVGDGQKVLSSYDSIMSEDGAEPIIHEYESMVTNGNARQVISAYEKLMGEEVSRQVISNYAKIMSKEEGRNMLGNYATIMRNHQKHQSEPTAKPMGQRGFLEPASQPSKNGSETLTVESAKRPDSSEQAPLAQVKSSDVSTVGEDDARRIISNYGKTLHQDDSRHIISTFVQSLGDRSVEL